MQAKSALRRAPRLRPTLGTASKSCRAWVGLTTVRGSTTVTALGAVHLMPSSGLLSKIFCSTACSSRWCRTARLRRTVFAPAGDPVKGRGRRRVKDSSMKTGPQFFHSEHPDSLDGILIFLIRERNCGVPPRADTGDQTSAMFNRAHTRPHSIVCLVRISSISSLASSTGRLSIPLRIVGQPSS